VDDDAYDGAQVSEVVTANSKAIAAGMDDDVLGYKATAGTDGRIRWVGRGLVAEAGVGIATGPQIQVEVEMAALSSQRARYKLEAA